MRKFLEGEDKSMNKIPVKIDTDLSLLYRDETHGIDCSLLESPKEHLYILASILNIGVDDLDIKKNWYVYNHEYYYLKKRTTITCILNELLGEYISRYMELPTITYELALENQKIVGLLSKNFRRKDKKYIRACDLGFLDIFRLNYALSINSKDRELHETLIRIVVKDYFVCMRDRLINTLCEKKFNHIGVAPSYDYELSFDEAIFCDIYTNPLFQKYKKGSSIPRAIDLDIINSLMQNDDYFQEQFAKILEFDMVRCLDNLRDYYKINIPEEVAKYYVEFTNNRKEKLTKSLKKVG